jgi:hypothetical protein
MGQLWAMVAAQVRACLGSTAQEAVLLHAC